jgi:hypothetical protein
VRGAVVDVHCEDEEDDVDDDEEGHQEREPSPERSELRRRRRGRAAPVLVARPVAGVVLWPVAAVVLALGPALAAVHVNGDHRRLAPPRHGAGGEGKAGKWRAARGMRARAVRNSATFASWRDGWEEREDQGRRAGDQGNVAVSIFSIFLPFCKIT